MQFREVVYVDYVPRNIECILAADIGGTNSNFGLVQLVDGKINLLFSLHIKSQNITNFISIVQELIKYVQDKYAITIRFSAFAVAGVASVARDYAKPTNLDFAISSKEILEHTHLSCAFVVNDFVVIGYGVDQLDPKKLVKVNEGHVRAYANKAVLGAGTGLGKCIMMFNYELGWYEPSASEGGHADFPAQDQLELDLIQYIHKKEQRVCNISWEDVLSGNGIKRIYSFFLARAHGNAHDHQSPHPDEIFNARNQDEYAKNTFDLYAKLYARCAKDLALNALALGGVYIAGGIAAKNLPLFQQEIFLHEFVNCGKQQELLKEVPLYVITDYNVSLYGVAAYMILEGMCDPLLNK
ncbi:MAG TPA: glucokinase [Candidatus Dependentiae bacterium]|nr:glucokinase [Candidatus Dependentiae bacterium]HRQ62830.1 glucokinase [Candidatus Dependentiae bacterium]